MGSPCGKLVPAQGHSTPFHSLQKTFQARSGDCCSLGRARCDLGDPVLVICYALHFQLVVFGYGPVALQHLLAESAPKQEPPKANPRSRQEICNAVV